jgi:LPPG:FO 2-phospho-L-lactate transferase
VGAARFLRGLVLRADPRRLSVIVNTGDDEEFYGLHVSPDIDTITYTLAGLSNPDTGWGLAGESFNTLEALARFYGKGWFALGDRDLATHLYRTDRLRQGWPLSRITADIAQRLKARAQILPMSDDRVRTFVKLRGREPMPFQEYFVRNRARGHVEKIELRGAERARPLPAALEAIRSSTAVILAPSNPFVSIGPILAMKGMGSALASIKNRVAAITPLVGGKTIKGPADKMMRGLGHEVSPLGWAKLYRDCVGTMIIDQVDRDYLEPIREAGFKAVATDTIMTDPWRAAALADVVLNALEV